MKIEEKFMHQFIGFKKRRGNYRALITLVLFFYLYYTLVWVLRNEIITKKNREVTMNYSNENGLIHSSIKLLD